MIVKDKTMSSLEIDDLYKGNGNYRGVQYINNLKNIEPLQDGEFMVVAVDAIEDDDMMAHFVGIFMQENVLSYFNSYGIDCPMQVLKYGIRSRATLLEWQDSLKQGNSNLCGFLVCYILDGLIAGRNLVEMVDTLEVFPKTEKNRAMLAQYYRGR